MDITKTIAANLSAWMAASPGLDTVKKLEAKSGLGFGTIRRARNGEGNITVENLARIADAFRRHPAELLRETTCAYESSEEMLTPPAMVADSATVTPFPGGPLNDLMDLASRMNDTGLNQLIGAARILADQYPKADRGNAAN